MTILLKFEKEIKGNSIVPDHANWIGVDSVQFGCGRAISVKGNGTDRDTGTASVSEVTVSRGTDIVSPILFKQSLVGSSLGTATFHWLQTGSDPKKPQVFVTVILSDAIVSSYSFGSGSERPSESLSINFTKISYQYDQYDGAKVTPGTAQVYALGQLAQA